jgi:hypothetical protein
MHFGDRICKNRFPLVWEYPIPAPQTAIGEPIIAFSISRGNCVFSDTICSNQYAYVLLAPIQWKLGFTLQITAFIIFQQYWDHSTSERPKI